MGAAESSERQAHAGAQPASQGSPHAFHTTVLAIRTLSTRYPRSTLHTHAIPSAGSLKQLTSMGFSEEASKVALEVSAGNLQRAAQMLLEQQDQLGTPRQPAGRPGAVPPRQPAAAAARAAFASIPTAAAPRAAPVPSAAAAADARAAAARAAASRASQAVARPPPVSCLPSGLTPEQRVHECAQRLTGRAEAVDVLTTSLSRILQNPRDEKFRKVNISNPKFQQYVASAPGGMEFLHPRTR